MNSVYLSPARHGAAHAARLARALHADVIPRLLRQHGPSRADGSAALLAAEPVHGSELQAFIDALVDEDDERSGRLVQALRQRGVPASGLFIELLTPTARELGVMWEEDRIDFATATVSLGRLQRLMRELSPDFGREKTACDGPALDRRVLLAQPESEQHSFGLAMVAEFFRREGWAVAGGVGGGAGGYGADAVAWVRRERFDAVGFSIGSELALPWLRSTITSVRLASRNPALVVLVGGPIFSLTPALAAEVGADATSDGRQAPQLAEGLVAERCAPLPERARIG